MQALFLIDLDGLLVEGMEGLLPFQMPFVQPKSKIEGWSLGQPGKIALPDVVKNAQPTVLIGVSGQSGAFSEEVIRSMAASVPRPVIFPPFEPHVAR